MYFIFRHSKKSGYKDKIGKVYHFTEKSPNFEKVRKGAKILLYEKEKNSIVGIAKISKIEKRKVGKIRHFFAYYENFEKFKEPLFCDEKILEKLGVKIILDSKLPGIIPIRRFPKFFQKFLNRI